MLSAHYYCCASLLPALPAACPCCTRYGAVLVLQGSMSLGELNSYMLYAIFVSGSAGGVAGTAASLIAAVSMGWTVHKYGFASAVEREVKILYNAATWLDWGFGSWQWECCCSGEWGVSSRKVGSTPGLMHNSICLVHAGGCDTAQQPASDLQ